LAPDLFSTITVCPSGPAQPIGKKPRHEVGGPAGGEPHDQPQRPIGIVMLLRRCVRGRKRKADSPCKALELTKYRPCCVDVIQTQLIKPP
jgi:hypothetical protein